MTALIPEGKSRLLLVEGKEDQEFFIRLGYHLQFSEETPLHILQYEGKDKLAGFLYQLIQNPEFNQVLQIGIVRDADYNTDAFQSVQSAIRRTNQYSKQQLPVPQSPMQPSEGKPEVSVLILPADTEGMLEDLVLDALNEDSIMSCVDDFFTCLGDHHIDIAQERLPKARVRVFITGKNVDGQATAGADADKLYLSDIYRMSWWRAEFWEHESFHDARAFLRQLVMD